MEDTVDDQELAELADANYVEAFAALTEALGGPVLREHGITCTASGTQVAEFNVGFVTTHVADPKAALAGACAFFDGLGLPFLLRIRESAAPEAEGAAEALGMTRGETVPGMALYPVSTIPAPPGGFEIERVGPERLGVFLEVMASGFGMPVELARAIMTEATLEAPGLECYVGSIDGVPVATSTLYAAGRAAGVYNVATLASHRRRGLGEAMTWHAVREGARLGCDVSILQASEMGRPIYERMGYRLVAPYRTFHR